MIRNPNSSVISNYGVHKAVVVSRGLTDGSSVEKIQVWIPSYHGALDSYAHDSGILPWALCSDDVQTGDVVWVSFEGGDIRYPVYMGSLGTQITTYDDQVSELLSSAFDLYVDSSGVTGGSTYSLSGSYKDGYSEYTFEDPVTYKGGSYNAKWIFDYLIQTELPVAAVVGILGYMWGESSYNPAALNGSDGGAGLCQWTYFKNDFVNSVPNWETDGYGQLDYLINDLRTKSWWSQLYNILLSCPNTAEGVYTAAGRFSTYYGGGASFSLDEDLESVINRYDTTYYGLGKDNHIDSAMHIWEHNVQVKDTEPATEGTIMTQQKFLSILNYACDSVKTEYNNNYPYNVGYILRYENGQPVYGFDCSGLIKGILRGWDARYGIASYDYTSKVIPPDSTTEGLWAACYNRSSSLDPSTMTPGEMMHMNGHVGVYVGNNQVIESTTYRSGNYRGAGWTGVVRSYVTWDYGSPAQEWTGHGKLPWIDYTNGASSKKKSSGTSTGDTDRIQ